MIDLHMHSSCSDGTLTPEELAAAALDLGLEAAALTDHDTVSGVRRFLSAAAGTPLHAVPGVELASMLFNKDIHIGNNVWIGAGAIVLPGVTIGENSVIGAGSVVTKDIPANVVAVGNPCRVMREIGEEEQER